MKGNDNIYLSVIIPAYNEADRISNTIEEIINYLNNKRIQYEIIVVNDGSDDSTAMIVKNNNAVKLIDRKVNRGKGYSVAEGMLSSRGDICLFTDADNSTDIRCLESMMELLDKDFDIVIASRHKKDSALATVNIHQPKYKEVLGKMGNFFIRIFTGLNIYDTQCGFKAFKSGPAKNIFSKITIDRWGFDVEALTIAKSHNYKIGIIPANWEDAPGSHVKSLDYIGVLRDVLRIRLNMLFGKYKPQPLRKKK